MRDRKYRRNMRERTINKCKKMLQHSNFQGGLLYEKHVDKINNNGFGYVAKHGTQKHFVQGNNGSEKVRDRDSWEGTTNWNVKDIRQQNSMDDSEQDFYDTKEKL